MEYEEVPKYRLSGLFFLDSHVVVREVLPLALAHLLYEILVTIRQGQSTGREDNVIGTSGSGSESIQLAMGATRAVVLAYTTKNERIDDGRVIVGR